MERKSTLSEAWHGGYYELALEIGERSDENLPAVIRAVWQHPLLEDCYLRSDTEPGEQERIVPASEHLHVPLFGLATLRNNRQVACGTFPVREDEGLDWLTLYVPMGALGMVYDVGGYPFGNDKHQDWRIPLEDWLADIGLTVYETARFQLGLIGMEGFDWTHSAEVAGRGILDDRDKGYLWAEGDQMRYYPTTRW